MKSGDDEEICCYTSDTNLRLPDNELIEILKEYNPEWFDWQLL